MYVERPRLCPVRTLLCNREQVQSRVDGQGPGACQNRERWQGEGHERAGCMYPRFSSASHLRMAHTQYVTVILDEGDHNIQSSSRQERALEKEWCELLRPEMCGSGNSSFLSSCFQEVYLTCRASKALRSSRQSQACLLHMCVHTYVERPM